MAEQANRLLAYTTGGGYRQFRDHVILQLRTQRRRQENFRLKRIGCAGRLGTVEVDKKHLATSRSLSVSLAVVRVNFRNVQRCACFVTGERCGGPCQNAKSDHEAQ